MTAPGYPQWIVRRAGWFLLALHLPIVVMPLLLVTTGGVTDHDLVQGVFAVVVIPVMGLLHLRHILAAARGDRPVGWQWTLLAQALLVYLPMPWVGVDWVASTLPLMASAMLMLPGHRGVAIGFGVPFAASGVMYVWQLIAHLNGREQIVESVYFVIIITVFGFELYGTVRLVNELDGTRTELAQLAVDRERVRGPARPARPARPEPVGDLAQGRPGDPPAVHRRRRCAG